MKHISATIDLSSGSNQEQLLNTSYSLDLGISVAPYLFVNINKLKLDIAEQAYDEILKVIGAKPGLTGPKSADGLSLLYDVNKDQGKRLLVILSFGESSPMLFKLRLEGVWEL